MLALIRYWVLGVFLAIACVFCFAVLRSTTHFECNHATETCNYRVQTLLYTDDQQVAFDYIEGVNIEESRGRRSGTRYKVVLVTTNDTMPVHSNGTSSYSRTDRLASQLHAFLMDSSQPPFTHAEDNRQMGTIAGAVTGFGSLGMLGYAWFLTRRRA
jgi:hypothetical protein